MKKNILYFILMGMLASCQLKQSSLNIYNYTGDYVTSGYFQRQDGYDWTAVSIEATSDTTATVLVRSRNDKKKPTCTFEGLALLSDHNDTLTAMNDEQKIYFSLLSDTLSITSNKSEQLSYYCSGGATLSGKYTKLNEPLDKTQLKPSFNGQKFTYPNSAIFYTINHEGNNLTIITDGLSIINDTLRHNILGYTISNIEIGDLNNDTHPELFIYLISDSIGRQGKLIAYSPNNGKSISEIHLPDLSNDKDYKGYDEMAIVENTFCRRFPILEGDHSSPKATGKYKQIQYKLVEGETGRILKIDKILEF